MKIKAKDFRMAESEEVDLRKWPTKVDSMYKSKKQYQKLPGNHVAQLSAQQQLLYADNRTGVLPILQAMDATGKDGVTR